jgi:N-methylhydantoinase A
VTGLFVGCDVGGTFTDAVVVGDERERAKTPTTPEDPSKGAADAVEQVLDEDDANPRQVDRVVHGTTTATNAVLEGDLADVALVTNERLEDVVEIRRQTRPSLYDLDAAPAPPLVDRDARFGVTGRVDADGSIREPVDEDALACVASTIDEHGYDAVAVARLHAHATGENEAKAAQVLRQRLPDRVRVVTSHETRPEPREVERFTTTIVNAGLAPLVEAYLERLTKRLRGLGIEAPVSILDSAGWLMAPTEAARRPVRAVLSGPAGGAAGTLQLARSTGTDPVLGIDMGGTSTDVILVRDDETTRRWTVEVGGHRVIVPCVDVHTVGAGGGSIAWRDEADGLRVGPDSAGADPGPACYGRGGTQPTVTDANVALERLPTELDVEGALALDRSAALDALAKLGNDPRSVARQVLEIASASSVRGIRRLAAHHALDTANAALAAFGGAGPQFGAAWARRLGIDRVLVPAGAGVTSAKGLLAAPPRAERSEGLLARLDRLGEVELADAAERLAARAREALVVDATRTRLLASLRYEGQGHELTVVTRAHSDAMREDFQTAHREHHGYALDEPVELVTLRAIAEAEPALDPETGAPPDPREPPDPIDHASAWFLDHDEPHTTPVYAADALEPGRGVDGPAIAAGSDTTIVVPPDFEARVLHDGTVRLDRRDSA